MNTVKLNREDLQKIKEIADKYEISISEIGNALIEVEKTNRLDVKIFKSQKLYSRVSEQEMRTIEQRLEECDKVKTKSDYVRLSIEEAIKSESYVNLSNVDFTRDNSERSCMLTCLFKTKDIYDKFLEVAEIFSVKPGTLLRTLVMKFPLE